MPLRVAVVGVGHIGRHHARILSSLPDVQLVAVADRDEQRARGIAAECGTSAVVDFESLIGAVDAAVVAVPTALHDAVAIPLLDAGVSVLVEKPVASSTAAADRLIAAAAGAGSTLAVGHSERFNPALIATRRFVESPRFIEAHRLGAFPERSLDIDVVFDVMIHDLDVVLSMVNSPVVSIDAVGVPVLTGRVDIANARLRFANGCIANLTASRVSREPVRKIRFFQPSAYLSIDFAAQEVQRWRVLRTASGTAAVDGGAVPVAHGEPLRLELMDFVAAASAGRRATVAGEDGRRALALAEQITAEIAAQQDAFAAVMT